MEKTNRFLFSIKMLLQAIKKDWTRVVTHLNILKTYLYILHVEERKSVYNSSDNHDD